jgi:ankyrin repeat protein
MLVKEFHSAIERNDVKTCQQFIKDDPTVIRKAFGHGFDERSPLCRAAECGSLDVLKLLVDVGVDVNEPDVNPNSNALWWACERGHVTVVEYLKSKGAVAAGNKDGDAESDSGTDYSFAGMLGEV